MLLFLILVNFSGTCLDWARKAGHYDSVSIALSEVKGKYY